MKLKVLIFLLIFSVFDCPGQVSIEKISLKNGPYSVGFKHYLTFDSTRTYNRIFDWNHKYSPRPIPFSIWYPSNETNIEQTPILVLNYLDILKEEEEWEYLPNEQILNWFYYPNTPENQEHLKEQTFAYANITIANRKFPVIIYAPSYQASSIENFALCEFLASHGYFVFSSPSRGTDNRFFEGGTAKDLETQARDIEFLISEIGKYENADKNKIAAMGFSFGGLSIVLAQMRNHNIKALVSLDGSIRYQYATLKKSPFADIEKVDVPFIQMSQKEIPEKVLIEDNIDPKLNNEFIFFDSLKYSKAYSYKFYNLSHSYFSTLGVLFQDRDLRQDKSDPEIMESYRWLSEYTLNFLNAFLKNSTIALDFLEETPEGNGIKDGLISKKTKEPLEKSFSFQDFNVIAAELGYINLYKLYVEIQSQHPSFELAEGMLNNLGLQLVFNPETSEQGINVFLLAIKIYPESANLFDSVAEAYLYIGNKEKAIQNFERSLELNPQNLNAANRLKELKK